MSKRYIELKFNNNTYDIYVINEDRRIKLSNKNVLIMSKIIKKYPHKKINSDTIIYPDLMPIMITFYREKSKIKRKKINRKKSKNILRAILLTISLSMSGGIINNAIEKSEPENNLPKIETESNNDKEISHNITNIPLQDNKTKVILEEPTSYQNNINIEETVNNTYDEVIEEINLITTEKEESENKSEIEITDSNTNYFDYEFETPGDKEAFDNSCNYMDVYEKYERIYGVDANLLCAIGAQESSGIHKEYSQNGYATGIMGIENVWDGETLKVFNFETNSYETITVDYSKIGNLDYNVQIGAGITQNSFYNTLEKYTNIDNSEQLAFSLQKYNMGAGNINKVLSFGDNWINNRSMISAGDELYFEHVLSRLSNNSEIKMRLPDGSYHTTILNNNSLEKSHTKM